MPKNNDKYIIRSTSSEKIARMLSSTDEEGEDSDLELWDMKFQENIDKGMDNPHMIDEDELVIEDEKTKENSFENQKKKDIIKNTYITIQQKGDNKVNESNTTQLERD